MKRFDQHFQKTSLTLFHPFTEIKPNIDYLYTLLLHFNTDLFFNIHEIPFQIFFVSAFLGFNANAPFLFIHIKLETYVFIWTEQSFCALVYPLSYHQGQKSA